MKITRTLLLLAAFHIAFISCKKEETISPPPSTDFYKVTKITYTSGNYQYDLKSYFSYTGNNLSLRIDSAWNHVNRTEYSYMGNNVTELILSETGLGFENNSRNIYTIQDHDTVSILESVYSFNNWLDQKLNKYIYNAGQLLRYEWYGFYEGTAELFWFKTYTYGTPFLNYCEEFSLDSLPKFKYEFSWSGARISSIIYSKYTNGEYVPFRKKVYTYFNGSIKSVTVSSKYDSGYVDGARFDFYWDKFQNVIEYTYTDLITGKVCFYKIEYEKGMHNIGCFERPESVDICYPLVFYLSNHRNEVK